MTITTRSGARADIPAIFELVKELAVYEKALDQVSNTVERMERDYDAKLYDFHIAQADGVTVGLALYYYRYSTWKGKRLYLEDIVITESIRGNGLGKTLFDAVIETAKATNCTGMMWQVLDWNTSAVGFYRKYGTHFDDEWLNCNLDF